MSMMTAAAPEHKESFIYLYQDSFKSNLLATCKVEVYSLVCIRNRIKAGSD